MGRHVAKCAGVCQLAAKIQAADKTEEFTQGRAMLAQAHRHLEVGTLTHHEPGANSGHVGWRQKKNSARSSSRIVSCGGHLGTSIKSHWHSTNSSVDWTCSMTMAYREAQLPLSLVSDCLTHDV